MQRILILSDSHGNNENVEKAIKKAGKIDKMIHLGDVGYDYLAVERMSKVPVYMVAGNNDYGGFLMDRMILQFGSHKVFVTHGHREGVYMGLDNLRYNALQNGCDIAMFGHTHVPVIDIHDEDVTIINPGSVSRPRQIGHKKTFIIMEIDDNDKVSFSLEEFE